MNKKEGYRAHDPARTGCLEREGGEGNDGAEGERRGGELERRSTTSDARSSSTNGLRAVRRRGGCGCRARRRRGGLGVGDGAGRAGK